MLRTNPAAAAACCDRVPMGARGPAMAIDLAGIHEEEQSKTRKTRGK
jgi:hypothetical protein